MGDYYLFGLRHGWEPLEKTVKENSFIKKEKKKFVKPKNKWRKWSV